METEWKDDPSYLSVDGRKTTRWKSYYKTEAEKYDSQSILYNNILHQGILLGSINATVNSSFHNVADLIETWDRFKFKG